MVVPIWCPYCVQMIDLSTLGGTGKYPPGQDQDCRDTGEASWWTVSNVWLHLGNYSLYFVQKFTGDVNQYGHSLKYKLVVDCTVGVKERNEHEFDLPLAPSILLWLEDFCYLQFHLTLKEKSYRKIVTLFENTFIAFHFAIICIRVYYFLMLFYLFI